MEMRSATALALTLCGCTFPLGNEDADPGSASIGPAGGSVSFPDGPRLIVPPGALSSATQISIVRSSAAAPGKALSSVYRFQPETIVLALPASVVFPLPDGASGAVIYWARPGAGYEMMTPQVEAGMATAQVNHLGTGYAGVRPAATRTVSGVPEGRYLLQVDTIYPAIPGQSGLLINQLIELTTSTPDLSTVVAARPDLEIATVPTRVTLDISNLTPWVRGNNGFTGDAPASATSFRTVTISAISAPWDTLDRPPFRTGVPLHQADCLTAVFVP